MLLLTTSQIARATRPVEERNSPEHDALLSGPTEPAHVDWSGACRPSPSRAPRGGSQSPPRALRPPSGLRPERRRATDGATGRRLHPRSRSTDHRTHLLSVAADARVGG